MVEFPIKLLLVARSKLKSRARLEAENIVLRQQVIVLSRKARSRLARTQIRTYSYFWRSSLTLKALSMTRNRAFLAIEPQVQRVSVPGVGRVAFSASSLARDFSLVRATSSSLIRNSNIWRSSITLRSIGHPGSGFRYQQPPFHRVQCKQDPNQQRQHRALQYQSCPTSSCGRRFE